MMLLRHRNYQNPVTLSTLGELLSASLHFILTAIEAAFPTDSCRLACTAP